MAIQEIFERIKFWRTADRIGPDIPWTHWKLHFNSTMRAFCKKKFRHFDATAELRPGSYFICPSKISIGKGVIVRPGSFLAANPKDGEHGITIEDEVLLGPGVHMYTTDHEFKNPDVPICYQDYKPSKPIVVKRGAWIGANVVILAGVTIGENSVIGAGSVVSKDIQPRVVAAGSPARVVRSLS
ncbi:MAG: acyltransferase [Candidatus Giovannonibacteria bacterium]|nr:MAG: acyltransferase [Candidatus Giovannonibacteria bacterium]